MPDLKETSRNWLDEAAGTTTHWCSLRAQCKYILGSQVSAPWGPGSPVWGAVWSPEVYPLQIKKKNEENTIKPTQQNQATKPVGPASLQAKVAWEDKAKQDWMLLQFLWMVCINSRCYKASTVRLRYSTCPYFAISLFRWKQLTMTKKPNPVKQINPQSASTHSTASSLLTTA